MSDRDMNYKNSQDRRNYYSPADDLSNDSFRNDYTRKERNARELPDGLENLVLPPGVRNQDSPDIPRSAGGDQYFQSTFSDRGAAQGSRNAQGGQYIRRNFLEQDTSRNTAGGRENAVRESRPPNHSTEKRAEGKKSSEKWVLFLIAVIAVSAIAWGFINDQAYSAGPIRVNPESYTGDIRSECSEMLRWYREDTTEEFAELKYDMASACEDEDDYENAVRWYKAALEDGYTDANYSLGIIYYYGYGGEQDYGEAMKWFKAAAEGGDTYAYEYMADMYYDGLGADQDYEEAFKYYQASMEVSSGSKFRVAYMYDEGLGVEQNYEEALRLYLELAENGSSSAKCNIGYMYDIGRGVEQDYGEALKWYYEAAEGGDAQAMNNIGYCYEYGHGVEKNMDTALEWYRKAADLGNDTAKENLRNLGY